MLVSELSCCRNRWNCDYNDLIFFFFFVYKKIILIYYIFSTYWNSFCSILIINIDISMNINDTNANIENTEDIVFFFLLIFTVRWNSNNFKLKVDILIYYYIFDKEKCEIYFYFSSGIIWHVEVKNWNFAVSSSLFWTWDFPNFLNSIFLYFYLKTN